MTMTDTLRYEKVQHSTKRNAIGVSDWQTKNIAQVQYGARQNVAHIKYICLKQTKIVKDTISYERQLSKLLRDEMQQMKYF